MGLLEACDWYGWLKACVTFMSLMLFVAEFGRCLEAMEVDWKVTTDESAKILYTIQNTIGQMQNIVDHDLFFDHSVLPINDRLLYCQCKEIGNLALMLAKRLEKYQQIVRSCTDSFKMLQAKTKTGIIEEKSVTGLTKSNILKYIHQLLGMQQQDLALKTSIVSKLLPFEEESKISFVAEPSIDFYKSSTHTEFSFNIFSFSWAMETYGENALSAGRSSETVNFAFLHHKVHVHLCYSGTLCIGDGEQETFTRITMNLDSIPIKAECCRGFCRFLVKLLSAFRLFKQLDLSEETLEARSRGLIVANMHINFILPSDSGSWLTETFLLYICNGDCFEEMRRPIKRLFQDCFIRQKTHDSIAFYHEEIDKCIERITSKWFGCGSIGSVVPRKLVEGEAEQEFHDVLLHHQQTQRQFQELSFVEHQTFFPIL